MSERSNLRTVEFEVNHKTITIERNPSGFELEVIGTKGHRRFKWDAQLHTENFLWDKGEDRYVHVLEFLCAGIMGWVDDRKSWPEKLAESVQAKKFLLELKRIQFGDQPDQANP